ncbi:hypothetical protein [Tropicibacter naphthalenivorans]|uniref:Capsule polysaccharide biosynthesis protein n=1 Tax=Tropicibacter naphthalenivorans TaxID=441103 RepID=A0A0P1GUS8_9RHOB|nr:hypothetical protein [Tropicibacter naphthalenivorans]CUH79364.1 hypothetical protein TRN7648_02433 [Tropicibacter naphthalenivorans]SMC71629.1 hypothetical protein SAMN04488093_10363 [Tropicibacter naphthalenivorans]
MKAHLYLYPDLQRRVAEGRHGFLCALVDVLKDNGFDVQMHGDTPEELDAGRARGGYSVVRMIDPLGPQGVTFRKTYYEPFYHLETTSARWTWPVAQTPFDPNQPAHKAARFVANMRARIFGDRAISRDGFIFVPLQGRLLEKRSFQTMTPIEMLETLLEHDTRKIVATLHPRETYTAPELTALEKLEVLNHRFFVTREPAEDLLASCDYVATMNSSVALAGYFIEKPALLFGQVDFHHIAARYADHGPDAIAKAPTLTPDYAAYLWWFFRVMAIRARGEDAHQGVRAALKRAGWPIR